MDGANTRAMVEKQQNVARAAPRPERSGAAGHAPLSTEMDGHVSALPSESPPSWRGHRLMQQARLLHMQRTLGNQAVQRFLPDAGGTVASHLPRTATVSMPSGAGGGTKQATTTAAHTAPVPGQLLQRLNQDVGASTGYALANAPLDMAAAHRAADVLRAYRPDPDTVAGWRDRSSARRLPVVPRSLALSTASGPLPPINLHEDHFGGLVAMAYDAEAVTIGRDIYLREGAEATPALMAHEMAHVAQSALPGAPAGREAREREAEQVAAAASTGVPVSVTHPGAPREPMTHPAVKALLRSGRWLGPLPMLGSFTSGRRSNHDCT